MEKKQLRVMLFVSYMLLQDSRCSWHSLDGEVYHEVTL